jgi:hypothetical protein
LERFGVSVKPLLEVLVGFTERQVGVLQLLLLCLDALEEAGGKERSVPEKRPLALRCSR